MNVVLSKRFISIIGLYGYDWRPAFGLEFYTAFTGTISPVQATLVITTAETSLNPALVNPVEIYAGTWADGFAVDSSYVIPGIADQLVNARTGGVIALATIDGAGGGTCTPTTNEFGVSLMLCSYDIPISALNTGGLTKLLFRFKTMNPCLFEGTTYPDDSGVYSGYSTGGIHMEIR